MKNLKFVPNEIEAKGKGKLNTFFVFRLNVNDQSFHISIIYLVIG
jgi:hypothetical protein